MQHSPAWQKALIPGSILAVLLLIGLPLLNAFGILSDYYLNLFGKYLALAILALGMDLIWGYAGILSLGQAIFFGCGAYAMGMYLMLESSGQGVYGERIPDFMVWNRVTTLPWFWKPFQYFPLAVFLALAIPAVAACIFGVLTFRRRVSGTYFAILTQAMAFATWLMCNRNEMNLGGTNGLTDFKSLLGVSLHTPFALRTLYLVTALCLVGSFIACKWLVGSKMGLILTAMRDQEQRLRFLGYPIAQYKIFIFALAAALAGLSGALYAPQVGIITPSQIGVLPSLEVVVWVATGGRGTLIGALLGAVGINAARSLLTASYPEWWPIILGGLFVGVVILFPDGLVGIPNQLRQRLRRTRAPLIERSVSGSVPSGATALAQGEDRSPRP
jgi:urea transport system permease protein